MRRETLWIAALLSTNIRETSADGCCFWPQSDDRCDVGCESIAESSNYCAGGVDECNVDCGAVWCYDGPQPSHEPTRSRAPTPEGGAWHEAQERAAGDCAWVSRDLGRCSAKGDESYAWQSCPATCGTCAYDCADGGDSSSWHKNGDETKDCAWASGYYYNRASVVGADGSYAWEGCPAATHVCYHAGCGDDSSWHKRGEPAKDCAWPRR
ncbi:FK506 binding protein [Aureococcus anophagefferens]|nr:FK506 binding protein [Aureococcus anophagefferens]